MAKKKKTREQKILAEIHRRQELSDRVYHITANKDHLLKEQNRSESKNEKISTVPVISIHYHQLLIHDLRKTIFLTLAIISLQIILYLFFKL